jgi:hypothetical protein
MNNICRHPRKGFRPALLMKAHLTDTKFPGVAAIYLFGSRASPPITSGTGVYIGTSRDGRKGLVLTLAHIFEYRPRG